MMANSANNTLRLRQVSFFDRQILRWSRQLRFTGKSIPIFSLREDQALENAIILSPDSPTLWDQFSWLEYVT